MVDFSISLAGMERAAAAVDRTAARVSRAGLPSGEPADSVDLSAETIALLQAQNVFTANARVVQAQADLERAILNILV
jgi:flagellar hook protein FlgE